jgi:hypothetical protein
MGKFRGAENVCLSANASLADRNVRGKLTPYERDILFMSRRKIAKCLGPFSWDSAESHFSFGPGAAVAVPRRRSDAYYKFGVQPTSTKSAELLARCAIKMVPLWESFLIQRYGPDFLRIVPGNKVVTVPKNAKTDRTIAIEPLMNIYIQKGIGALIRYRLKRCNIDLDDQTVNQRLAREGSINNSLATIDLSMASDTVARRLVEMLLPEDWFQAMDMARSHRGVLPDHTIITYEKFSSMGNGFTFELESLIFWAIVESVRDTLGEKGSISIYGDDIIAPGGTARAVLEILPKFGFTPNVSKTFIDGPFRESCGKHYFRGVDVTPFYVRDDLNSVKSLVNLANNIRLFSNRNAVGYGCDSRLRFSYELVLRALAKVGRVPRVPLDFGDAGVISNFDEARPAWSKRYQSIKVRHYSVARQDVSVDDDPILLKSLYGLERRKGESSKGSVLGFGPERHRISTSYVTQWHDLGPWY